MQKKMLLVVLMLLLVFSFSACKSKEDTAEKTLNQELVRLLPEENFRWAYFGPGEYYHEMTLQTITAEDKQAIYRVAGEVEDVSNGEANKNYNIDLYYVVNHDSIIQNKTEETMLDSKYDSITIIKAPLEVGNKWTETVKDKNGKKDTIYAEIIEITDTDNGIEYKVAYKNKSNDYYESRKIIEGYGIIAFTKSEEIDGEKYNYGYGLYGKNSGYIKTEDIGATDNNDADSDASESTDASESADVENSEDSSSESSNDSEAKANDESTNLEDEKQMVKDTITSFNNAWIEFVNEDNQDFFNYVTSYGVAYKNAKNFKKSGLKEKFLVMRVNSVNVSGNTATAKVYEEIEKTKDGEVSIAKYNWLYDLVKKDGKWLVNGYSKQN